MALLVVTAPLLACTPKAQVVVTVPERLTNEALFGCATQAIAQLRGPPLHWQTEVTRRDPVGGVLETGNFHDWNRAGFRLRLVRESDEMAVATVKAAGTYFTDLGAEVEAASFKNELSKCLTANYSFKPTPLRGAA